MLRKVHFYILWLASMIVNNNTDTAQNKNIALFVVLVVAVAVAADTTIILLLLLPWLQIDCIPLSTDVSCGFCLSTSFFHSLSPLSDCQYTYCLWMYVCMHVYVNGLLNALNYKFYKCTSFGFTATVLNILSFMELLH